MVRGVESLRHRRPIHTLPSSWWLTLTGPVLDICIGLGLLALLVVWRSAVGILWSLVCRDRRYGDCTKSLEGTFVRPINYRNLRDLLL